MGEWLASIEFAMDTLRGRDSSEISRAGKSGATIRLGSASGARELWVGRPGPSCPPDGKTTVNSGALSKVLELMRTIGGETIA